MKNVEGLKEDDIVDINGLEVGNVQSMELYEEGVLVTLDIKRKYKIPINSKFYLIDYGLLGPKGITIKVNPNTNEKLYKNNDTIIEAK